LVATNLWTHSQVLHPDIAILTDPDPQSLAEGIRMAAYEEDAQIRARAASKLAESEYTDSNYLSKIEQVLSLAASRQKER
jgi:hypothetical protein